MSDLVGQAYKEIDKRHQAGGDLTGVSSGFKKLDNMIFVFSKDTKAIYNDNNHLVKDKNSFINPLDKPIKDEKIVKEKKIKSTTGIKII